MDATKQFAEVRSERTSAAGRALIEIAAHIFATATEREDIKESRQWILASMQCDKAVADGDLAGALAKSKRKESTHATMDRARAMMTGRSAAPRDGGH